MTENVHRYVDRLIDDREQEERLCPVCGEAFWGVAGLCPHCRDPKTMSVRDPFHKTKWTPEYRKKVQS